MKILISGALIFAISTCAAIMVGVNQASLTASVWGDVSKKLIDAMEGVR